MFSLLARLSRSSTLSVSAWKSRVPLKSNLNKLHSSACRPQAQLIDGVAMAKQVKDEVKADIEKWVSEGHRAPKLTAIQVGDDPASKTYLRNKAKAAEYTGITTEIVRLPVDVTEAEAVAVVEEKNRDPDVDGIIFQLPVPEHIRERVICNTVLPSKDVDGFTLINVGRVCTDLKSLVPATPAGVIEMIKRTGIPTFGKNALVCGRSKNVGLPIAMLLHADGIGETGACDATTTICHRYTPREELMRFAPTADIIVTATGLPGLITADMVKEGATVIDVGITRIIDAETGKPKLVGDVDFDEVSKKAGFITPVPGGVGPMTVAMLMKNTLIAARGDIDYSII